VVVVVAIVLYLTALPPRLADGYVEEAEPEHQRIERAMRPVTESFNATVLGTIDFDRKSDSAYLRAYLRVVARDKRELVQAQRAVRRARRVLVRSDEEALTEAPSGPLLNGRGDLKRARELAAMETEYLRGTRRFLRDYDALLTYQLRSNQWVDRVNLPFMRAETQIPDVATSLTQITGPLDRAIRLASVAVRGLQRLKPPKPMRAEHRRIVAEFRGDVEEERAVSRAVARDDFALVRKLERGIERRSKKLEREGSDALLRLTDRSPYKRQITELQRRESEIFALYQEL
jgi:hypothetical protein